MTRISSFIAPKSLKLLPTKPLQVPLPLHHRPFHQRISDDQISNINNLGIYGNGSGHSFRRGTATTAKSQPKIYNNWVGGSRMDSSSVWRQAPRLGPQQIPSLSKASTSESGWDGAASESFSFGGWEFLRHSHTRGRANGGASEVWGSLVWMTGEWASPR